MHADAKQAVSTADASSMTKWASRYEHGDGTKQDMDRAAKNGDSQPSVYSYVWESHQMLSPNHAFCPAVRL